MCEITNKNFMEKFPEIVENMRSASFLSIDCEFSGLYDSDPKNSFSLLDNADQIFYKKRKHLENYHIVEFGLSTFIMDKNTTNFNVASYTFYLLPFINDKKVSKMTWQLSTVDFLRNHKFNFNKLFYDGVSYLNKMEEEEIMEYIFVGNIANIFNENDVIKYKHQINNWLMRASNGDELILDLQGKQFPLQFVLQFEIRKSIDCVWTSSQGNNVRVLKVTKAKKNILLNDKKEKDDLLQKMFDSIWGFSKIMYEIEELKKPIVGHNVLLDLMLIYLQFYNRRPVSYSEFKKDIHRIFPCIYDTKIMANSLKMKIPREDCWKSSCLSDLFIYFKTSSETMNDLLSPRLLSKDENFSDLNNFHDAGFDAYAAGYCFVKMAYLNLVWDDKKKKFLSTTLSKSFTPMQAAISHLQNLLYVSRAKIKWIDLNGSDPENTPAILLFIRSKSNGKLDSSQITDKLSEYYSADFKPLNRYSGIIAVDRKHHAKEIRKYFEASNQYVVSDYSFLKHSFWGKTLVRGFFVSAFLVITSEVLRFSKIIRSR